jgi:hypothetical protein
MVLLFSGAAAGVMATRTAAPAPTITIDPAFIREQSEVTSRFFQIMKVRERALTGRNQRLLSSIYTPDSPQLTKDRDEIKVMLNKNEVWRGLQLPVQILKMTKVSERHWTVVALLGRSDAKLMLESGALLRAVPGNRQVYWCTLLKDPAKGWLISKFVPP